MLEGGKAKLGKKTADSHQKGLSLILEGREKKKKKKEGRPTHSMQSGPKDKKVFDKKKKNRTEDWPGEGGK